MKHDTTRARELLINGQHTCVLCKEANILTDDRRGVRPLLDLLAQDLTDYCAADKVVGKAAALLYRLLGVSEIYACVISEPAVRVLEAGSITVFYDHLVPAIRNRTGTGFCPMETAVWDIDNPVLAPAILLETLQKLNNTSGS